MVKICRCRAGYAQIALAAVLTSMLSQPTTAQIVSNGYLSYGSAPNNTDDTDRASSRAPDVLITAHDVVGEFGVALPLEIKLVHGREVVVEAIKLLGVPLGATIRDTTHTFSTSNDDDNVDISSWDLSKLQITQRGERNCSFLLAVAAIWTLEGGGHVEVAASRFNVNFVQGNRDRTAVAGGEPGSPELPATQARETGPVASLDAPVSGVFVPEAHVAPVRDTVAIERSAAPADTDDGSAVEAKAAAPPRPAVAPQPAPRVDPLVERAKGLIRLGDISGARLLLERAQARKGSNATFLLAQTWDPAMLRAWKVRGLRADPDLARGLYAKAAGEERADEQVLAATGR